MNFLDTYDIAGQNAPPQQPEQSLNEEVTEVIGQLGRLWGGFRKQSQTVLETARKDFGEVVTQAQKELTRLTSEPSAQPVASTSGTPPTADTAQNHITRETADEPSVSPQEDTPAASTSTSSIFTRLQSVLPPNILETARNQIPESLKNASSNIDLPQLRANFLTEFQRVQGVTRAQAEEYAHKSEALIRDAVKEAGEVLKDAVKVLPPEESGSGGGLVWDGSDMWSLPLEPTEYAPSSNLSRTQRRADAQNAVATRAESLFRRLRDDPVILKRDPAVDGGELYSSWVGSEITSHEGGITGTYWSDKIALLLDEPGTGEALKRTRDVLVPSDITEVEFWTRYSFRAHQIETEEKKRKALLEGTLEEDDFSWEDDEDEAAITESSSTLASTRTLEAPDKSERKSESLSATSSSVATQDTSEEYDVVSSGNVSPSAEHKLVVSRPADSKDSSDGDSDWE